MCLVAPLALTFTLLHYQKLQTRRKVERDIFPDKDHDGLVLLKFTKKDEQKLLRWEHSREFEYADQMYDVVKTEAHGDTSYYWCWWDKAETKLNQQLEELLVSKQSKHPIQSSPQEKLIDFFKSLYCSNLQVQRLRSFVSVRTLPPYGHHDSSIAHPPPVPPPKASA